MASSPQAEDPGEDVVPVGQAAQVPVVPPAENVFAKHCVHVMGSPPV